MMGDETRGLLQEARHCDYTTFARIHAATNTLLLVTSAGRVRVIACRTLRPFYRNLNCSPTASLWHPRSPIRS
jgi:hypothetical protein